MAAPFSTPKLNTLPAGISKMIWDNLEEAAEARSAICSKKLLADARSFEKPKKVRIHKEIDLFIDFIDPKNQDKKKEL